MNIPRMIIAATHSGAGKTTLTAGLIAAYRAQGLRVAPFKIGPDYIDPSYHALAAGAPCHNLDTWMLSPEQVRESFVRRCKHADLAIIEGVMGLFDGKAADDDVGSAAHVARLLDAPIVLVLDARAMARTAAVLVKGITDFDPRLHIGGFVANRVGSAGHAKLIAQAAESIAAPPMLGHLVRNDAFALPERHLGLVPTSEAGQWKIWLTDVQRQIENSIQLEALLALANRAPNTLPSDGTAASRLTHSGQSCRIAIARDAAFSFIYDDNLDLLVEAGAQLEFFSPLTDTALPDGTHGLYLGGGFPELYASDLSANVAMRQSILAASRAGMPIYAECGGLMYLTERIIDQQGQCHMMVGALPGASHMSPRLNLGYREVAALQDNWLWRAGETMRGHEFHYSTWANQPAHLQPLYRAAQPAPWQTEGAAINNTLASYVHLHWLAKPELAARFVAACRR
ncbi:MAG: cobyrinate a,c-diamide synthase [Anaerolineae bacterium]|nr:cobyrinate a,c-diamide synthase [Anaerolineae bacterium]